MVATRNFYLDPTHQRPIPPELLFFVAEFHGFARTKIVRLQESEELARRMDVTLQDVLGGASPDYSVIAQKPAVKALLAQLDGPFSTDYGIGLESLTARYQDHISTRFEQSQAATQQSHSRATQAEAKADQAQASAHEAQSASVKAKNTARQAHSSSVTAEAIAQQAKSVAEQALHAAQHAHTLAQQAETRAQQSHQLLHDVLHSRSWRMTAPLRWCVLQWRQMLLQGFWPRSKTITKKIVRPVVIGSVAFVYARPVLKKRVIAISDRLGLYESLHSIYRRVAARPNVVGPAWGPRSEEIPNNADRYSHLTSRERDVYADLTAAIKKHKEMT